MTIHQPFLIVFAFAVHSNECLKCTSQAMICVPNGFTNLAKAEDEHRVVELVKSANYLVKIVVLRGGSVWTDLGSSNQDHAGLFMHMISGNMRAMDW